MRRVEVGFGIACHRFDHDPTSLILAHLLHGAPETEGHTFVTQSDGQVFGPPENVLLFELTVLFFTLLYALSAGCKEGDDADYHYIWSTWLA